MSRSGAGYSALRERRRDAWPTSGLAARVGRREFGLDALAAHSHLYTTAERKIDPADGANAWCAGMLMTSDVACIGGMDPRAQQYIDGCKSY
jgi:hypothetical protein